MLKQHLSPAVGGVSATLITPRNSPIGSTETIEVPSVALPPFPTFTPNLQLVYLASKHRIATMLSKPQRRKCSTSCTVARVTRRRKRSDSTSGSTSLTGGAAGDAYGGGSEQERCKTAMSDFLMDGAMDEMDLSDDEAFSVESEEKPTIGDKYHRVYLQMCKKLRVNPCACFVKGMKASKISLTNYELGPKGVKPCCVALALNPPVQSLDLNGNNIGPVGTSYISEVLSENTCLTELTVREVVCTLTLDGYADQQSLENNRLGSDGARLLSKVLLNNEVIKVLNLSGNGFEEKDAIYFADVLRENQTLRELYLSHNCFRERGGETLGPSLADNVNLEVLDLSWNHLRRKGAIAICEGLKNNIGLKTINLAWNGLYQEGCKALAKALVVNRTLTELDVSCNRIDRRCLDELLKGLMKNESIETFRVGQNPLTTDGAIAILRMLEKKPPVPIKVLDLAGQCVDNGFVRLLAKVRESRPLEVCHGNLLRKDEDGGGQGSSGYIDGDPMMILMEYMRLQNLRLVDMFVVLDTDGSKSLTRKEFREGLMKASIPISPEGLDRLISKLDSDGDGEVDYAELIQGQKEHKRKLAKLTKKSKEENIKFEETEVGRINAQLKVLIAMRNAAQKEALKKKSKGLAAVVGAAMEMNRKNRPSSGLHAVATAATLLAAAENRPNSPSIAISASMANRPTSGSGSGKPLRPLTSVPRSTSDGTSQHTSAGDRLRRALTPKPDLFQVDEVSS